MSADLQPEGGPADYCPRSFRYFPRLVYADSEANYCPTCQTGGHLLADRSLSRLLKDDWPRTLEELEARKRGPSQPNGDISS